MPEPKNNPSLPLSSLEIAGFRGINHLTINKLGRVSLLAGQNGAGKTTVLDAVRVFALRGDLEALITVLERNEEYGREIRQQDERDVVLESPNFEALFHGRIANIDDWLSVGANGKRNQCVRLEVCDADSLHEQQSLKFGRPVDPLNRAIKVVFGDYEDYFPIVGFDLSRRALGRPRLNNITRTDRLTAHIVGPGISSNYDLDRLWGEIALTDTEPLALQALNLVTKQSVEAAAMIPGEYRSRRVFVKLTDGERVPLRSLGDGATRLFALAVTLVSCAGGFLLIDEAENGIHHTLLQDYWRFILRAAEEHNVQVIATTHSWDCIQGFARAATENQEVDGVAVRLEPRDGMHRAIEYSEEELVTASEQGIEVR